MLHFKNVKFQRTLALLLALCLLAALAPLSVHAEETQPSPHAEPIALYTDDCMNCISGFLVSCANPDDLPMALLADICRTVRTSDSVKQGASVLSDEGRLWITLRQPETNGTKDENAAGEQPSFIVEFHDPENGSTCPEFLCRVPVEGKDVYVLAPDFCAVFQIGFGQNGAGGYASLSSASVWYPEADIYLPELERPQAFAVRLTQQLEPVIVMDPDAQTGSDTENPDDSGELPNWKVRADSKVTLFCYLPEGVHTILSKNAENPAYFEKYGISPSTLYLQLDVSTDDAPSAYSPDKDSVTAPWEGGYLSAVASKGILGNMTFDFSDETFRALLDENCFITYPQNDVLPEEDDSPSEEEPSDDETVPVYYAIDPEKTTLHIRARFVLPFTAEDGIVRYAYSAFTDVFSCGAQNSDFPAPAAMEAPTLKDGSLELLDDGGAVLSYILEPTDSQRAAAVWAAYSESGTLTCEAHLSLNGGEWIPAEFDTDSPDSMLLSGGNCTVSIPAGEMTEYAYIRIRSRYVLTGEELRLESPWSESFAFENKPEGIITDSEPDSEEGSSDTTDGEPDPVQYVCPICGICSAPHGVCLFIWIGAAIVLICLVAFVIAIIPRKKRCPRCGKPCRRDDKICTGCGFRFVGEMPEFDDDDEPKKPVQRADIPKEPVFSYEPKLTKNPDAGAEVQSAEKEPTQNTPAENGSPSFSATPEFLNTLRAKMKETKAGGHPHFTPEEIAYIKVLREKAKKQAEKKAEVPAEKPAAQPPLPPHSQYSAVFRKVQNMPLSEEEEVSAAVPAEESSAGPAAEPAAAEPVVEPTAESAEENTAEPIEAPAEENAAEPAEAPEEENAAEPAEAPAEEDAEGTASDSAAETPAESLSDTLSQAIANVIEKEESSSETRDFSALEAALRAQSRKPDDVDGSSF